MKYLIFGLGNIGDEYLNTRHNFGFQVLDEMARKSEIAFQHKRLAFTAELKHKGRILILIKPTTYMNLSGKTVRYWMQAENVSIENIFVIVDDIALPFGSIRIKEKGSAGGHNGLTNIIEIIENQNFARLRFGIGNEFMKGQQSDYVLGNFSKEQQTALPERIDKVIDAIKSFACNGIQLTMTYFNGK